MSEYAQSQGISVQNTCYHCALVSEYSPELRCLTCDEDKEGRDDYIAYELVDEGNLQYNGQAPLRVDEPSGHDWIASQTVIRETRNEQGERESYVLRLEYTEPIVQLADGGVLDELWELDDWVQKQREVKCKWCNLMTPKQFNDCQDCDKPLELNIAR